VIGISPVNFGHWQSSRWQQCGCIYLVLAVRIEYVLWLLQSQQKDDVVNEQKSAAVIHRRVITRFHRCGSAKFPKLEDCAHFHYDFVSIGRIQVTLQPDKFVIAGYAVYKCGLH